MSVIEKKPKRELSAGKCLTPIRSIRRKCLDCSAGQAQEVRLCPVTSCALYPFRLGKNPNRAGLGNRQAFARLSSDPAQSTGESTG